MRAFAATAFNAVAYACLALFGTYALAWSIRLAFGLPLGQLGWIGFGFAACGLVAHLAAARFTPSRRARNQVTATVDDAAAKRAVADLKIRLADLERRRV